MEYAFSDRIKNMTGNAIRDIFKLLARPEVISFAGGMPAADALPAEQIREIASQVLKDDPTGILQYGATEAYAPLRQSAAQFVKDAAKVNCSPEDLFIISGGQQGLDLTCKAFLNKGDRVLVERPTYLAALQIMATYEAEVHSVNMDEEGMLLDELEEKLKIYSPKLIYTIPNFQNPTGRTASLERRRKYLELAEKYNAVIIEDDPYGLLRYEGEAVPSIKSMDTVGRVIYVTSFSKVISPGLRVGAAVAAPTLLRKMIIGKQATDVHTNSLSQAIIDKFLRLGYMPEQLAKSNKIHSERMNKMQEMIKQYFPSDVKYTRPSGGLFIWAELREDINTLDVLQKSTQRDVAFIPGSHFFAEGDGLNTMRLNFSNSSFERIEKGIKILAETIAEF